MFKKVFFTLCIYFLIVGVSFGDSIKSYVSFVRSTDPLVIDLIKKKIGIEVIYSHNSFNEIDTKIRAEAPNFNVDMILGCGIQTVIDSKKNKWSHPYLSKSWNDIPKRFYDSEGYYYTLGNMSFVFVGNKNRLEKLGYSMPQTWKDLLDPKWKNEIVIPSPLDSGIGNTILFTILEIFGETEGWKYMEALDKNINHYTKSANSPTELIGRGEFLIGIASDEQIIQRIKDGFSLVWNRPKEGTGYQSNNIMILNGTKKLDECKKIVDLFASKEMMELLSLDLTTTRPTVSKIYGNTPPNFITMNNIKIVSDKIKNNEIWKQKFKIKN